MKWQKIALIPSYKNFSKTGFNLAGRLGFRLHSKLSNSLLK
jgi:hypothetical protein